MRILKRNLAFMLAMIMALSLTAFAGYEDYSDVEELTYVEAVDVLTELGIVEGSNGALLPTGNLTRAQAAKLIAYTMLGKKAADALQADVAPFVDVPTYHWAAGYVEYCADQGIVGGMGDGTFAPEANVTGSAFAKMLLCAVGYGEKGEFTGASWDSTVNAQGTKLGIFDGNEENVVFANAVTREEAFLYTFNALTKVMEVTYSADADEYYAGTVFNSIKGFDFDETLGAKLYDLSTKSATDVFGRDSYNWYKGAKKIAGMYHEAPKAVYTTEVASKTIFADLDLDNTTKATLIDNGVEKTFNIKKNDKTVVPGSDNGVLIEAYIDEDMNVTLIKIDTYLAKVEDVLDEEATLEVYDIVLTEKNKVVETDLDLAKGDYVLITVVKGEIQTVAVAEKINGVLDAHGAKSNYTKMDGTKYLHSAHLVQEAKTWEPKYDGAEMVMVMDEYGYMIALKPVSETENLEGYVLVTGSEVEVGNLASAGKVLVEVLNLDGTGYDVLELQTRRTGSAGARVTEFWNPNKTAVVDGKTVIKAGWSPLATVANGFYGYAMTEDGEIVLMNLEQTSAKELPVYEDKVFADGKQQFEMGDDNLNLVLDNDSVMHLVTDKAVETLEGYKNIKIDEPKVNALAIYKGRTAETIYVVDGNLIDRDLYAYYNGTEFEVIGSKTYAPLFMDGELQYFTWAADVDTIVNGLKKGDVVKVNLENKKIVAIEVVLNTADQVVVKSTAANGKYFNLNDLAETNVTYADGVKIYDMTKDGVEIDKVVKGDTIVYMINKEKEGEVATRIWVVKHNSKEAPVESDAAEVVFTKNENTWRFDFANLKAEDKVVITAYNYAEGIDGVYATYSFTQEADGANGYQQTYDVAAQMSFVVTINGTLVYDGPVYSFVK